MAIRVDTEALASDGVGLGAPDAPHTPTAATPPGADAVSVGAVAQLLAHAEALDLVVGHAHLVRAAGGLSVTGTAEVLHSVDAHNAALFGSRTPPPISSVPTAPVPAPPVPPAIPAMPPLPPLPGEAHAIALHTGNGSQSLRSFSAECRARATDLGAMADSLRQRGISIDQHWQDGYQRAGANTIRLGTWVSSAEPQSHAIASTADSFADDFDTALQRTPTPQEFQTARTNMSNAAAAGNMPAHVRAQQQIASLQAAAFESMTTYHGAVASRVTALGTPLPAAPPIKTDGGDGDVQMYDSGGEALTAQEIADRLNELPRGDSRDRRIVVVPTENDLFELYEDISQGGSPLSTPENYYERVVLPDGTFVGVRESGENGPTIDVAYPPGVQGPTKVHIEEWPPPAPPAPPSPDDRWGTYMPPEERREPGSQREIPQRFLDALDPPPVPTA